MPEKERSTKKCFVVMPISDVPPYETGHFKRVYDYLFKPACTEAGFEPFRADDEMKTNHIIIDILKRVIESDMVLCDISSRNPNVFYELGIRQAFNLPVTIVRDNKTPRVFDIQGLRDIEYDINLRVDTISPKKDEIKETLKNTYNKSETDVNSIIQLLSVKPAEISTTVDLSNDTTLILKAIKEMNEKLSNIDFKNKNYIFSSGSPGMAFGEQAYWGPNAFPEYTIISDPHKMYLSLDASDESILKQIFIIGDKVEHKEHGVGTLTEINDLNQTCKVKFENDKILELPKMELNKII